MSIVLPGHDFPYWSDPEEEGLPPALIVGAGLSVPLVPLPNQLASDFADRQREIEQALQIDTEYKFVKKQADELYCWAGHCIKQLMKNGTTEIQAKQRLVRAMGLLEDERFAANAKVPLRGTTPRHRVLARFAREGDIHSMWSLNWDLWLEAAFEAVGLTRLTAVSDETTMALPRDWKKAYQVWLPPDVPASKRNSITLYKPHGCIQALSEQTNSTFRITESELSTPASDDVKHRLQGDLGGRPICAIGWGATEENLQEIFTESASTLLKGELTVIGLNWNDGVPSAEMRHSRLASNFSQVESNTLCTVKPTGRGTTDDLMQWIQALRSLRRLYKVVEKDDSNDGSILGLLGTQIKTFSSLVYRDDIDGWALSWFDTFFPVWVRLCFTSKALVFQNDGDVLPGALSLVPRDAHIPLNDTTTKRLDILTGAYLYCSLLSSGVVVQSELDFESYPGAYWHEITRTLLIPVPMWSDPAHISFAALKPLVESRHWAGMSRVGRVCMLRVNLDPLSQEDPTGNERIGIWKQQFCSLMRLRAFVDAEKIDDQEIADLSAYLQNRKGLK